MNPATGIVLAAVRSEPPSLAGSKTAYVRTGRLPFEKNLIRTLSFWTGSQRQRLVGRMSPFGSAEKRQE